MVIGHWDSTTTLLFNFTNELDVSIKFKMYQFKFFK